MGLSGMSAAVKAALALSMFQSSSPRTLKLDNPIPDFVVPTVSQRNSSSSEVKMTKFNFAEHKGKVIVLMFATVQCNHTKKFTPKVAALKKSLKTNDVEFVVVRSSRLDTMEGIARLLDAQKLDVPLIDDARGELAKYFMVSVAPTFVIIDRNGLFRFSGGYVISGEHAVLKSQEILPDAVKAVLDDQPVKVKYALPDGCALVF